MENVHVEMLMWRYSCGDGHSCPSGRAKLDLQRHKSRLRLADRCRAVYEAALRPTFTKPMQFFTNLYATFLVHPGLHPPESKIRLSIATRTEGSNLQQEEPQ